MSVNFIEEICFYKLSPNCASVTFFDFNFDVTFMLLSNIHSSCGCIRGDTVNAENLYNACNVYYRFSALNCANSVSPNALVLNYTKKFDRLFKTCEMLNVTQIFQLYE